MSNQTTAKLGLGLAALGRPGYINLGHGEDLPAGHDVQQMQTAAHKVMDLALELGIVYFDAARSYGRAEQFLAAWLDSRKIQPGQITIASKWGYTYTADWNVSLPAGEAHEIKEHSLARLDKQFSESKELIGDHLDLYQIHSATLESGVLENSESWTDWRNLGTQGYESDCRSADRIKRKRSFARSSANGATKTFLAPSKQHGICWSPLRRVRYSRPVKQDGK